MTPTDTLNEVSLSYPSFLQDPEDSGLELSGTCQGKTTELWVDGKRLQTEGFPTLRFRPSPRTPLPLLSGSDRVNEVGRVHSGVCVVTSVESERSYKVQVDFLKGLLGSVEILSTLHCLVPTNFDDLNPHQTIHV